MTRQYHLESALLPQGWGRDVLVTVADDGHISGIDVPAGQAAAHPDAQRVAGFVVPGMPNAHSHAFQRGMAGNTEYRLSARDSFWTWRRAMYALANRITPDDLQVLATQLFVEMLKVGYTSVAEFHYLHRQPGGEPYAGANGLWEAVGAAAEATGIGLTFLPTLYQTSDFGAHRSSPSRRASRRTTEWFLRAIEERCGAERRAVSATRRTGAAFHSLRAVPLRELARGDRTACAASIPACRCTSTSPSRPRRSRPASSTPAGGRSSCCSTPGLVDRHWCLVHATHATAAELAGIAATTAAVCVSMSTEANLGDGFFDALRFLKLGGRVCIGSDSQATVCPAEELRWMEYQQRLRKRRRGVLAEKSEPHVGTRLWREAAEHGASALGQPAGTLAVGRRADWLVLDATHPSMAGATAATALDHLLFAGGSAAIRDVMVAGRWVVEGRRHRAEEPLRGRFLELMAELAGRSQG